VISQVLQNGVAIPTLPAGGSVQVMFFRNVTAAAGTTVSMTATVSAPTGVSDPNPANNSSTATLPVVASTSSSSGGNGGGTPPASGPRPLGLGSAFANETTAPSGVVTATFLPAGAYTDLYWEFSAQDNPSATTASLRFRASITGASAGHTFDVEILERTTSGDVTRSLSGTSQNPTAGITWSNVPGRDDSRVFVVRVRQASGPVSSTPLQLRLDIGGPAGGQ
jgi:hypothetical protein